MFGSSLRLPGSLTSDDPIDRMALHADPSTEFQRSAEIRSAAQKALFKLADKEAVHRATNARSRIPHKTELRAGDVVYVWRNKLKDNTKGWIGPGVVV